MDVHCKWKYYARFDGELMTVETAKPLDNREEIYLKLKTGSLKTSLFQNYILLFPIFLPGLIMLELH